MRTGSLMTSDRVPREGGYAQHLEVHVLSKDENTGSKQRVLTVLTTKDQVDTLFLKHELS